MVSSRQHNIKTDDSSAHVLCSPRVCPVWHQANSSAEAPFISRQLPIRQITLYFRDLSRGTLELYVIRGHLSTLNITLLAVERHFLRRREL